MRYPGSHKHEKVMKRSITVLAVAVFGFGFVAANRKQSQIKADTRQGVTNLTTEVPSPEPTPTSLATLQIFDGTTKVPLTGQSIVLLRTEQCLTQPCPASSPLVVTADERGRIAVSQTTLQLRPKIYAAGYKLDTYFSFLDPANTAILTLYQPMDGTKVTYDITLESIPIGLTPVKSP